MTLSPKIEAALSTESTILGRNFLWMSWSGVISIANSVLIWIFLARMRDLDEVGRFTIVMGIYALFYSIVSLGLMPYLVNEISRRSSPETGSNRSVTEFISSAYVFLLISGVICSLAMSSSGLLVSSSWQVRLSTIILSLAMIPTGIGAVCEAAAIAQGRARLVAVVSTIENVLRTIVPLGLIFTGFDIVAICISFAAVRFVAVGIYLLMSRIRMSELSFVYDEFKRIATACPTFAGTIVFASLNWQAPVFLLGYFSIEAESAKFGAASRFLIPVTILMASYANVIQPALARQSSAAIDGCGAYLSKMAKYPIIVATLATIGSLLFSRQVLTVLFGESYQSAAPTLDVLSVSVIPFCLVMVASRGLIATNSQKIDLAANVVGVVVCLVSGAILIPRYGAVGAAAGQLFAFLSMAIIEIAYLSKRLGSFSIWRTASLSSASLIIIYLVLWKY